MIDWQHINTVFFDMDGTLLDLHFDNHFWLHTVPEAYAQAQNITLEAAKAHAYPLFEAKRGSLDWYSIVYWGEVFGLDIIRLKEQVQHKIQLRPKVIELLEYLQSKNKRMLIVTNAHPATLDFKLVRVEIGHYFAKMLSSHDLNLAKEEPGFWQAVQTVEPFDVAHTLFIDDSPTVLQAARDYGFKHLFGISLPDLHATPMVLDDFVTIDDFSQLMPS